MSAPVQPLATSELAGPDKAVTLLLALGAERAAEVLRHLEERELEPLSFAMAEPRKLSGEATTVVLAELIATAASGDDVSTGGIGFAQEVLENAVGPERTAEIVARLTTIESRPFESLRSVAPEQIYASLRTEAPQAIALTVASLRAPLAARVFAQLPEDQQADVARRIATMNETSPDVMGDVEDVVRRKLANVLSGHFSTTGGVEGLADILSRADRNTERNVLDALSKSEPDLAEGVRRLMFVFEDIVSLDDRGVQLMLKEIDHKALAVALRGVTDEVAQKILANMSNRGAEILADEIDYLPPQRRSVVEEAQGQIVATIRGLEERGALEISHNPNEEALI